MCKERAGGRMTARKGARKRAREQATGQNKDGERREIAREGVCGRVE